MADLIRSSMETRMVDIGQPVRRHTIYPLKHPVRETPEPRVPLPEKQPDAPAKTPERVPA